MPIWCIFAPHTCIMKRQSITFTEPNDEWLNNQVSSKEYSSKSELVNDLVRQARQQQQEVDYIRMKITKAEKSGFTKDSKSDILKLAKQKIK
jgi:antitoxin ParD1/3/4